MDEEGSRAKCIAEIFAATETHSVQSSCDLQTDVVSLPARRLLALTAKLSGGCPEAAAAIGLFAGWDASISKESGAAALFEVWWAKHLRPAVFAAAVEAPSVRALLAPGDPDTILNRLENPDYERKPAEAGARPHSRGLAGESLSRMRRAHGAGHGLTGEQGQCITAISGMR